MRPAASVCVCESYREPREKVELLSSLYFTRVKGAFRLQLL